MGIGGKMLVKSHGTDCMWQGSAVVKNVIFFYFFCSTYHLGGVSNLDTSPAGC